MKNVKLPGFGKRREFDLDKIYLCEDPDEKCDIVIGLDVCYENLTNMLPSGHWKDKKNSFKNAMEM